MPICYFTLFNSSNPKCPSYPGFTKSFIWHSRSTNRIGSWFRYSRRCTYSS